MDIYLQGAGGEVWKAAMPSHPTTHRSTATTCTALGSRTSVWQYCGPKSSQ